MTEEEISAVLDKAHACVESECAVDDVDILIAELKDQQKVLSTRLEHIMNVVAHLQHANEQKDRKKEDVRTIVKDMLRVFSTDSGKYAISFSGDIGDGPTTAYDALPPKPWKGSP
jgi:DNA repair exonuclease SbcCD ATPase subunit